MPRRPQRPAQHVLEDSSRRAFQAVLPPGWVCRWESHDYGVDAEVEIFVDGSAVGQLFKVQLKGTAANGARALRVRLTPAQAEYYGSLQLPLLVVLFHEPANQVYARWFQSFDPNHDRVSDSGWTMLFASEHRWSGETAGRIQGDVLHYHRLRSARAIPLNLLLSARDLLVAGVSTAEAAIAIRSAAAGFHDVVRFASAIGPDVAGTLHLDAGRVAVDLRSLASSTVHYPVPWPGLASKERVVADALSSVGVVLARFGHEAAAARLFADWGHKSSMVTDLNGGIKIMTLLGYNDQVPAALALAEQLSDRHPDMDVAIKAATLMVLAHVKGRLSATDRDSILTTLRARVEAALDAGDMLEAGRASYNAGNWLQSIGLYEDALPHFARAVELEPGYDVRPYYHAELAGCLFETRHFAQAASEYKRAMVLEGEGGYTYQATYADALMFAGSHSAAQSEFLDSLEHEQADVDEWHLKALALDTVRDVGGDIQARDEATALRLADVSDPGLDLSQRESLLTQALESDALCAMAWFNLGMLLQEDELHSGGAMTAFLIAALVDRYNTASWSLAAVLAALTESEELGRRIVGCAARFNGERFMEALMELCEHMAPEEIREHVLVTINGILAGLPGATGRDVTIRSTRRTDRWRPCGSISFD